MGKTKQGLLKEPKDLQNCPDGNEVNLFFGNGDEYCGLYRGLDGNEIILQSTESTNRIGLPFNKLTGYLQRTK